MKIKRRGKINRVNPVDFGLEELSKINKDDVVRTMDRSKERTGEKISSQSGLFVPKREEYETVKISASDEKNTVSKRKILSDAQIEDYRYGKTFAVGEQYIDNENYQTSDYRSEAVYSDDLEYDEYDDEFDIEDFFVKSEATYEDEINSTENINEADQATQLRELVMQTHTEDSAVYTHEEIDVEYTQSEIVSSDEETFKTELKEKISDNAELKEEIPDNAESKTELKEKNSDNTELKSDVYVAYDSNEEETKKETGADLTDVAKKIDSATSPKERLALEREAVRLGMADVLTDYDGSDMVRPELLEEIGFTPGGEKEPEIVKNKRFRFGKRKKEDILPKEDVSLNCDVPQKEGDKEPSESKKRSTIAEKQIIDNKNKISNIQKNSPASTKKKRSAVMHDPKKRREYILKNKKRLEKASEDLMNMQEKYDELTACINDIVLLEGLPVEAKKSINNTAAMVVKFRNESQKVKNNLQMDTTVYHKIDQNKEELPDVIRRLVENEKYSDKLKREIDRLENEKNQCHDISEDNVHRQKTTKNISIAVIVFTIITMLALIIVQLVTEYDMQIPILIFGMCAVLETLGIFVQHFKTETDETINNHKLNKIIKKQNTEKVKYVNAINAVEYVYEKYRVHSSSELLFQWETYQKVSQAREEYKIAGNEISYYEEHLLRLLEEYSFANPKMWVMQSDAIIEEERLAEVKNEMTNKRSKLMARMDKCKKLMGRLDSELSVLVIKFPQYADEIKKMLKEF